MTKRELLARAEEILRNDDDIFVSCCEELDCYNGLLGDDRCEPMDFFDDYFCDTRPLDIINRLDCDFNASDDYFYFDGCGNVCSTDYPADRYRDLIDYDDLVDSLVDDYNHIDIYNDRLDEVIEALVNEDYYDEDCEEAPSDADELPYGPARTPSTFQWVDEE